MLAVSKGEEMQQVNTIARAAVACAFAASDVRRLRMFDQDPP